jgi:hypothetical protein
MARRARPNRAVQTTTPTPAPASTAILATTVRRRPYRLLVGSHGRFENGISKRDSAGDPTCNIILLTESEAASLTLSKRIEPVVEMADDPTLQHQDAVAGAFLDHIKTVVESRKGMDTDEVAVGATKSDSYGLHSDHQPSAPAPVDDIQASDLDLSFFSSLSASDAIDVVRALDEISTLQALHATESRESKRVGVLHAIESRIVGLESAAEKLREDAADLETLERT